MKNIFLLVASLMFLLLLASCANDSSDNDPPAKIPDEVIEQAEKELWQSDASEEIAKIETKIIILNAKKWEYDKPEIRVKKGEKLILKVNNTDTLHGIAIPDMQLVGDEQIEVDTSQAGEFEFRCSNYCGAGHQEMTGMLIIEE